MPYTGTPTKPTNGLQMSLEAACSRGKYLGTCFILIQYAMLTDAKARSQPACQCEWAIHTQINNDCITMLLTMRAVNVAVRKSEQ